MRSVSDLVTDTKKPEVNGTVVLISFVLFAIAVMGIPVAMVWAANSVS